MKENYLSIVDEIVMKAFDEGAIVVKEGLWADYAISHRLLLYGSVKDGYYGLNELGIRYVMEGCSKGLKDKFQRQEEIERLEIDTKSFTKKKQNTQFVFSVISLILSILAFFGGFEALQDLLSKLSAIVESLCSS